MFMFYRYLLIFGLIFSLSSALAQEVEPAAPPANSSSLPYKRLRLDLNLLGNFSWFGNNNSFGAFGVSVEPKYSLTKHWSVGFLAGMKFRFNPLKNMDLLQGSAGRNSVGQVQSSIPALLFQYQLTGDFHLMSSSFIRPYLGLGLGALTNKSLSKTFAVLTKAGSEAVGAANENDLRAFFMVSPRLGVDLWHFRINIVYDLVFSSASQLNFGGTAAIDGSTLSRVIGKYPSYSSLTGQVIFYIGGGQK